MLTFAVRGRDGKAQICAGTHRRAVVRLARFETKAATR
jgi:predicted thioesterase